MLTTRSKRCFISWVQTLTSRTDDRTRSAEKRLNMKEWFSKDKLKKAPLAECGVDMPDVDAFCNALLKNKKQSSVELPEVLICQSFEDFFNEYYNQCSRSLFREKHVNLDETDPVARAVALNMYIATDKKLNVCSKFLAAVRKKDWKEAAKQCTISWNAFKKNNPSATQEQWKSFNNSNKNMLLSLAAQKDMQSAKVLQVAMANAK